MNKAAMEILDNGFEVFVKQHLAGGVYIKEMHLPAHHEVCTHSHNYEHMSILQKGRALVIINGTTTMMNEGDIITIKADIKHEIQSLNEPIVWLCIHSTTETDINKIDETLIKEVY